MRHEAGDLEVVLRRIALRSGIDAAVRTLARAAALGSAGLLLWALATLVLPLPLPLRPVALAGAGALAAAFPLLVRRRRPSVLAAARLADRRLGLADRIGTAVDLLRRPAPPAGLARLQVADALARARSLTPREVAPVRAPREAWAAAGGCALLVVWAQFLAGWSLPWTPAARTLAVIHDQGRALEDMGRRLEAAARARGLPETRRAAPQVEDLGRRLSAPHIGRDEAAALLREAGRRLDAARQTVERRLLAALPQGAPGPDARAAAPSESGAQRLAALEEVLRQLRAAAGQLRAGGVPADRADLSRRLASLSESLDRIGAPAARRSVEAARRDAERGRMSAAGGALGDALQDLQAIERMLADDQALGEAGRQVRRSSQKIAESAQLGAGADKEASRAQAGATPPQAPGPNPPNPGASEDSPPPPPGPNQGSRPGQGTAPHLGPPAPRPGATRVPVRVPGVSGAGPSALKEITGPGQPGAPRLPVTRPPAALAHEIDRALSRAPLPPAYLTVIRRYFEALGGTP
jgi:hypothetical protein